MTTHASVRKKTPFKLSPDPNFMYITDGLRETIAKIDHTIEYRQGLTVVYGDNGMGKSTLMRHLHASYLAREDTTVALLLKPEFSTPLQMIKTICGEFRRPIRHAKMAQESELWRFLLEEYEAERNVVLLVDEAQMLKGPVLECVRTLLNFETNESKLINIVLFGQLELRDSLRDKSKRAIASRVFVYSVLTPLTREDTEAMIRYRLERARVALDFEPDAIEQLYAISRGVPRDLVKLCDIAWLFARNNGLDTVPAPLVLKAQQHVHDNPLEADNGAGEPDE